MTYYSRANGFFIQADALGSAVHEAATSAVERPSHSICPGDEHSTTHHITILLLCSEHRFRLLSFFFPFLKDNVIITPFTYYVNRFL